MKFSARARALQPSPTLALSARAKELSAQGHPVINLSVGEPDWPTPRSASDAGIAAIKEGFTLYTASLGILPLREKIAEITSKELGVKFGASQVAVTSGAKFAIAAAMQILLDPGDEVLIPTPYWVSYPSMVELAGGVPRIIECGPEHNFKLRASDLRKAIHPKTRLLILCSPSNPTGLAYSPDELSSLVEVLKDHPELLILSDDIYNHLIFQDQVVAPHLLHIAPELSSRTLVVNGASKSFAMTGWRVGWILGSSEFIRVMGDYISQTTSHLTSISQKAALAALMNQDYEIREARAHLRRKKDLGLQLLRRVPRLQVLEPDGAFYFWLDVRSWLPLYYRGELLRDSRHLARILLDQLFLAVVPGVEFGCESFLRISFALSEKDFAEACNRLSRFSAELTVDPL